MVGHKSSSTSRRRMEVRNIYHLHPSSAATNNDDDIVIKWIISYLRLWCAFVAARRQEGHLLGHSTITPGPVWNRKTDRQPARETDWGSFVAVAVETEKWLDSCGEVIIILILWFFSSVGRPVSWNACWWSLEIRKIWTDHNPHLCL